MNVYQQSEFDSKETDDIYSLNYPNLLKLQKINWEEKKANRRHGHKLEAGCQLLSNVQQSDCTTKSLLNGIDDCYRVF